MMNHEFWDRVGKTFVEGFLASLIASLTRMDWNDVFSSDNGYKILLSVVIGAIAMAISCVWNGVISPKLNYGAKTEPEKIDLSSDDDEEDG